MSGKPLASVATRDLGAAWRWLPCDVCGSNRSHRVAIAVPPESLNLSDYHDGKRSANQDRTRIVCVDWATCWARIQRGAFRDGPARP